MDSKRRTRVAGAELRTLGRWFGPRKGWQMAGVVKTCQNGPNGGCRLVAQMKFISHDTAQPTLQTRFVGTLCIHHTLRGFPPEQEDCSEYQRSFAGSHHPRSSAAAG